MTQKLNIHFQKYSLDCMYVSLLQLHWKQQKSMSFLTMPYAGNDRDFLGKIWLSPPCKVNSGFFDEFW